MGEFSTADVTGVGAGISSHSSPEISSFLRKNGHSLINIKMESLASEVDRGTGDDLMIAVTTSLVGRARRFRDGVEDPLGPECENNLHS